VIKKQLNRSAKTQCEPNCEQSELFYYLSCLLIYKGLPKYITLDRLSSV